MALADQMRPLRHVELCVATPGTLVMLVMSFMWRLTARRAFQLLTCSILGHFTLGQQSTARTQFSQLCAGGSSHPKAY